MRSVFVDSQYWIAIVKPNDPWSECARRAREGLGHAVLVTTDEVLAEFLAALSRGGPVLRRKAAQMVRAILGNPNVKVVPQARQGFLAGLDLYERREDKEYSLTDCVSMNVMNAQNPTEVLTNDRHFEQEGFVVLVKQDR